MGKSKFITTQSSFSHPTGDPQPASKRKETKPVLRLGLLVDGPEIPAWAEEMLGQIHGLGIARVVLVVEREKVEIEQPRRTLRRGIDRLSRDLSWVLYNRMIDRHVALPDAFEARRIKSSESDTTWLKVRPECTRWVDRVGDEDLEEIAKHRVDVFIRLGFRNLHGGILGTASCGVWSFHHGDGKVNRGGPPGFWESMEGWPATGAMLQILTEDRDNGIVLERSWSRTDTWSLRDNRRGCYWTALQMMPKQLKRLHEMGSEAFMLEARKLGESPGFYSNRIYRNPSGGQLFGLVWSKFRRKAWMMLGNAFFRDQWMLTCHKSDGFSGSFSRYRRIVPPKDRFWADPHVVSHDGTDYVFFEEYIFSEGKGTLVVSEVSDDGMKDPVRVLERPYHLSYPFVFKWENKWYMIPESAENRTVDLYESEEFPFKWRFRKNLLDDVRIVDATLHHDGERWWMFAGQADVEGASTCDALYIYSSESLDGEWKPHHANPVVIDCRSARPAGPLFEMGGSLYRPSQDCSGRYGSALNLCRIDELNTESYRETLVEKASPDWASDALGMHSFSRSGKLHFSDLQVRVRR